MDNRLQKIGMILAVWFSLYYFCAWLFVKLPWPGSLSALWLSGNLCALSSYLLLFRLVPMKMSRQNMIVILLFSMMLNLCINNMSFLNAQVIHAYMGINLSLICIALCAGCLVCSGVKKKTHIIPLAFAAGMADIWSVTQGVTKHVVQSETSMSYLLLHFPVMGKGIQPMIGVADFIFAVLFMSLAYRFNLSIKRSNFAIAGSFLGAVTIAVLTRQSIPVLPVMGFCFITVHYHQIRITSVKEKKDTLLELTIIALVLMMISLLKTLNS